MSKKQAEERKNNWNKLKEDFHRIISAEVHSKYGGVCYNISYDEKTNLICIIVFDKRCENTDKIEVLNKKFEYPILNTDVVTKGEIISRMQQIIFATN